LRPALAAAALVTAFTAQTAAAAIHGGPNLKLLVATRVSDDAAPAMSLALWTKLVDDYVGNDIIPFKGAAAATLDDCRTASADYMVDAPFDLRPRLPGIANTTGRVAAKSHIVVTNCITGTVILDQTIPFDSEPPTTPEGDIETVPEISWGHAIPATFAKVPLVFARVAHVFNVRRPFAFVDIKDTGQVHVGDGLRDYASNHKARANPIVLTVTQVFEKYVEVTFFGDEAPAVGDLVEPLPKS
jgi:hypothetical protein